MKQQDYINWAKNKVNTWNDVDGCYGAQCVDLIMRYMLDFAKFQPFGNALDYMSNKLPNGWKRYKKGQVTPQGGDVAIWDWGTDNFGHVGIIIEVNGHNITSVEQNVDGTPAQGGYARIRTRNDNCLVGIIRPPYDAVKTPSIDEMARGVLNGVYGNGEERKRRLGANYDAVQRRVNELLSGKKIDIDKVAREVINGAWGNGQDRVNRLKKAGYDPQAVQRRVNELLR